MSEPDGVFDYIVNEKELPIDPALSLVFLRALLIVVAGAIFGIQANSVAISLTLVSLGLLLFASYQIGDSGILRSDATLYQSASMYVVPQLLWFGLGILGSLSLSFLPTASYLSLLSELPAFLQGVINYDLATFTENAFLISMGALLIDLALESDLGENKYFGWKYVLGAVAIMIAYIFVRLHGVRSIVFGLFAFVMMLLWFYLNGYEDLTDHRALPFLAGFMIFYSVHRANNIGTLSSLLEYYRSLLSAPPEFSFLFWIIFVPDLILFGVFAVGSVSKAKRWIS
jgi:hypothetical protein